MKIFIACSKYFYSDIERVAGILKAAGHEFAYANSYDEPMCEERFRSMGKEEHVRWKAGMMRKDRENIEPNDAVLVLNFEKKGISNYIGGVTFLEVYMAWDLGKKIFFYNDLPNCSFKDELIGIDPVVINGDLGLVR
jgi:hypothetical protein